MKPIMIPNTTRLVALIVSSLFVLAACGGENVRA